MNLDINQNNLYMLLPSKVAWLADMISEDKDINVVDAMRVIYSSETYKRLEDESTKLWHLGPVALYQDMNLDNSPTLNI